MTLPTALRTSVVICVYTEDRWDDIRAAVDSVRAQRRQPHELIIVVDHNPGLHLKLKREHPDAIVIENAHERGLSGGKNTGVEAATGDVVAFLDDDAVADPGWLAAFETGFADPAVVGVGGLTRPLWVTGRRPRWFPEEFDWTVGCTYRGMPDRRARIRNVMGGNAAFRREVVGEVGGFHTGIGRNVQGRRSLPLGCEETEFCIRLSQRRPGSVMLFEPGAAIGHKVPEARATLAYFRSRCYAEGLSKALVTHSVGAGDGLSSERDYTFKTLPMGVLRGLGHAVRGDLAGLGRAAAIVIGLAWTTWGYVVGTVRLKVRS
ncbi:glycosyltransferase [Planotetraspora sp. A-T 1434]|uniref:glycosyltransferase family 2 protein n=1 Tax=Planotetraspora sp. A-T 1434 TaxID=2979219 RepID=UPI0021C24D12|nr:glycosyltransferase family 2 protein [Planotetraspora sp. A-T 1434]MCT9930892.1 glycosyltransferase [Planotetraspora sp. A-T 1434]